MKKGYLFLFVIVSVFLVSAQQCERGSNGGGDGVFLGGKEGLVVEFDDDAPPLSGLFQNDAFPIDVRLINKGETEIGASTANIYLTGALFTSAALEVPNKQSSNDAFIAAVDESDQGRVEDSIVVPMGQVKYVGSILGDSVPLDVRASICYPYETNVQVDDFCIPSTSRRATGNDDCEIVSTENIIKEKDNSGGPVHVTSLREQKGPDFVRVTLDINNVGTGDVVQSGLCVREIQRAQLDKVKVKLPGGSNGFLCTFRNGESNEGEVELRSGHAVLRCKKTVNNPGSAFKESVGITLSYNYLQEITKTVTINKA